MMSKASEIEEWQNMARRYLELARLSTDRASRKMLNDLAAEAESMAETLSNNLPKDSGG
jgi:hypothetical protein